MALVTSVASSLKKSMGTTQVSTPEETRDRKKKMLGIVDSALEQFATNLSNGLVELDSSLDLERLIKCAMLLSGEVDSSGKPIGSSDQQTIETSKISAILDEDDPMVKTLFEKLYKGYNEMNDQED